MDWVVADFDLVRRVVSLAALQGLLSAVDLLVVLRAGWLSELLVVVRVLLLVWLLVWPRALLLV